MIILKISITLFITFILLISASVLVWAKDSGATLVLDMRNAPQLPKNFRSVMNTLPENINTKGLADLHIAGGAQFSRAALEAILKQLHTKQLVVMDLRQESHGMLNSNAVSWYGWHNAENAGKKPAEIEAEQTALLKSLGEEEVAVVNNILQKSPNGGIQKLKPIEYLVHQTSSEQELVSERKLGYKRIYVQDFHAPSDKEVDRFLAIVRLIPANRWIYFHCRAGIGRTTVFMTMFDMIHNAKTVSFDDIMVRQVALGGKDLTELPDKNNFKHDWAAERDSFIRKFYEYAHDNKNDFKTTWSEWKAKA